MKSKVAQKVSELKNKSANQNRTPFSYANYLKSQQNCSAANLILKKS